MTKLATLLLILGGLTWISAQDTRPNRSVLGRHYREGEKLTYRMKGINEKWRYEIQATGLAKRDSAGKYIEEYAWSNLISNGAAVTLSPASLRFRQVLSLDPDKPPSIPTLGEVDRALIGPILDFMTFYVDLWAVIRIGSLAQAGDHFYQKYGTPASWADGRYVVVGEDSIDSDFTLTDIDQSNKVATLLIRHVPPKQPEVRLPAAWMREPVADTPNNWVQVEKIDSRYRAGVGKETFDVQMKVSLVDGKILWGRIENPVTTLERECVDAALTSCGDPKPHQTLRQIEISLEQ
jgi:hypothetical protein